MMRSQSVRLARRAFSTEAKEAAVSTSSSSSSSKGSSFGQRLVSFTVGFGIAAGLGLYQLNEDVEKSTQEVQSAIGALKSEVIAQNAALTKRVEQLEKRK